MSLLETGKSEAAAEQDMHFPYGKCGDSPRVVAGCGAALARDEEEDGACNSYPDCILD